MVPAWRSMGWAVCVALLAAGCGDAIDGGDLEDEAFLSEGGEADEADDEDGDTDGGQQREGDLEEPAPDVEGMAVAAPIKCGGHFPLCPPGMECAPIRRIGGEIGYGHCK